jgi:hypothetical protein
VAELQAGARDVGTLSGVLADVAEHFGLSRDTLMERLFEKQKGRAPFAGNPPLDVIGSQSQPAAPGGDC